MIVCKHSKFYKMLWGRIILLIYHAPEENKKISNLLGFSSIFLLVLISNAKLKKIQGIMKLKI